MIHSGDHFRADLELIIGEISPDSVTFANEVDGKVRCLVSFGNWRKGDIEIMGAAVGGGITRGLIRQLARYVFGELKCNRITAKATVSNARSIALLTRLGFKREGLLRKADSGEDLIIFGLLPEDLKHGQFTETPEAR